MRVSEAMRRIPHPLSPDTPLLEAARTMAELKVTALPVCDHGELVGILTERALVLGAVQEDSDGDAVPATEGRVDRAMFPDPLTCREDEPLDEVAARFADAGARHAVVLGPRGDVVGVLALRAGWISEAPAEDALR